MTNRNVARRLERLEARLLPPAEEKVLILNLISADGEVVGTRELKLSAARGPGVSRIKREEAVCAAVTPPFDFDLIRRPYDSSYGRVCEPAPA